MMAELAELSGLSGKDSERICLAVDEACSNIIRHSYKGRTDGQIIIRCALEADKLKISIRDFGEKFDPDKLQPPDGATPRPGGLGIQMMKSIMDTVEYDCSHEVGTEIHLTKYLSLRETRNGSKR